MKMMKNLVQQVSTQVYFAICASNNLGNEKIESYGFSTMEEKFMDMETKIIE